MDPPITRSRVSGPRRATVFLWSSSFFRNEEYAVLKWFAGVLKVSNLPGLDIPGIDYCSIAQGYGVKAARVASRDELISVFQNALASQVPYLIEVPIQSIATPS